MEITLRAARINAGLTQEQVQEQLGISRSTLHRIETGKCSPKYKTLCQLCQLYGISPALIKAERIETHTMRRNEAAEKKAASR